MPDDVTKTAGAPRGIASAFSTLWPWTALSARRLTRGLLTLAIAQAGPTLAAPSQPVWVGVWRGTIGTAAVQVCLQHEDYADFGAYFYLRHRSIITLGKLGTQPTWTEAANSDKAPQGPLWHFSAVEKTRLQGSWTQGIRSLPFALARVPMARSTPDADDTACGNLAFSLPRFTKPVITIKPARLMGVAYMRVLADPGRQFEDSSTETFQLPGETAAIRRVNAELYKVVPTGPNNATYFTCAMAALGQNGLDGDASTIITPLIITPGWLVIQDAESDDCGGAHPNSGIIYETWDLRLGKKINLYDWFTKAALTQEVHDRGSQNAYVSVTFTTDFKILVDKAYPPPDADCRDAVRQADTWNPRLTADGVAFTPDLPHAAQACEDDAELSFARLAPYLTADGKRAVATFTTEVRQVPSTPGSKRS